MEQRLLRLKNEIVWSLSEDGYTGSDIAQVFGMEKSWINRIIKQKPEEFASLLKPVIK